MHSLWHRALKAYIGGVEHPAKYRLIRWLGRHAMGNDGIVASVYPGVWMWLNPMDWIEYLLLRDGIYEPLTLNLIRHNLQRGDHAICAGINNGLHEIVAALAVGEAGMVIGCDPQPSAILKVRRNMALNGIAASSLKLVQVGLAAESERGLRSMAWPPPDNHGAASLSERGPGLTVALATLGDVRAAFGLERVRLLLLDVQGHEVGALSGVGRPVPEVVIVEDGVRYADQPEARERLYACLQDLGYALSDVYGAPIDRPGSVPAERSLIGVLGGAAIWRPA